MEIDSNIPVYETMLKMDAPDFKKWVLLRSEPEYRDRFIQDMIDHEEVTKSFEKTAKNTDEGGERVALNVFTREKSAETVKWLNKLSELSDSKKDMVREVIFAKATSDYVHLGTHREYFNFTKET